MKITVLLFTALMFAKISMGQTTVIPDPNFEQALIDLQLDTGAVNGSIPTSNIDTVIYLSIIYKNVSSLEGIEDFSNLTTLDCSFNPLTQIDLSSNSSLEKLKCKSTGLSSLNISQNYALLDLNCSGNSLTTLDISQNINLITLYCWANNLTSLNVSQNTALETLVAQVNYLTSLDLSQNINLDSLDIRENLIGNLDITQNTNLSYIHCPGNSLTSLDISQNLNLLKLRFAYNQLETIDCSQNTLLEYIDCSHNLMYNLDFSNNPNLGVAICSYNQILCLNLRNGNNANLLASAFGNPSISCLEVDIPIYAWDNFAIDGAVPYSNYSTDCYSQCTVGISNNPLILTQGYPNPVNNEYILKLSDFSNQDEYSVKIIDSKGGVVLEKRINSEKSTINFQGISMGIYLLSVYQNNLIVHSNRIVKN